MTRLVVVGSVIGDQMMTVPNLPERGGDVLAGPVVAQPGGAFNIVAAAVRLGLETAVLGRIGTGPIGSMLVDGLDRLGATVLLPRSSDGDSGTSIGFIEPDGERTFVTSPGVEQELTPDDFDSVDWAPDDSVYVSGYDLVYPVTGPTIAYWLGTHAPRTLLFDPGPLVDDIPDGVLDAVLAQASVVSLNDREFALLGGDVDSLWPRVARTDAVIVERIGAEGAVLHRRGEAPLRVPGRPVTVVDSTGAGDAHAGAMLAMLAEGLGVEEAVHRANVAASLAVGRLGSASGPTREALTRALEG